MRTRSSTIAVFVFAIVLLASFSRSDHVDAGIFSLHVREDGSDTECTGYVDAPATEAPDCAFGTIEMAVAMAPKGGRITIGPGSYAMDEVQITQDVTIAGQPGSRPTIAGPGTGTFFRCESSAACTFRNLEFNGETSGASALRLYGPTVVDHVVFRDFKPFGGGNAFVIRTLGAGTVEIGNSVFDGADTVLDVSGGFISRILDSEIRNARIGVDLWALFAVVYHTRFTKVDYGVLLHMNIASNPTQATVNSNTFEDTYAAVQVAGGGTNTSSVDGSFNRFDGRVGLSTSSGVENDLKNNWWGCNGQGSNPPACMKLTGEAPPSVYTPWLTMTASAPSFTRRNATITVDFNHNSAGTDVSATGTIPDGTPVAFSRSPSSIGSVTPSATTLGGIAKATFTAGGTDGVATITASTDEQQIIRKITVDRKPPATLIKGPKDRAVLQKLARIAGTATDVAPGSGVAKVEVAVMRRANGKCEFWTGMGWTTLPCNKRHWLRAAGKANWRAFASGASEPGTRYWIFARATDVAGNVYRAKPTRGKDYIVVDVK